MIEYTKYSQIFGQVDEVLKIVNTHDKSYILLMNHYFFELTLTFSASISQLGMYFWYFWGLYLVPKT